MPELHASDAGGLLILEHHETVHIYTHIYWQAVMKTMPEFLDH